MGARTIGGISVINGRVTNSCGTIYSFWRSLLWRMQQAARTVDGTVGALVETVDYIPSLHFHNLVHIAEDGRTMLASFPLKVLHVLVSLDIKPCLLDECNLSKGNLTRAASHEKCRLPPPESRNCQATGSISESGALGRSSI